MKSNIYKSLFVLLLSLAASVTGATAFADMNDYCVTPPFVSQSISPNILIVLDNSGSMCGQAYSGAYNTAQFQNSMYLDILTERRTISIHQMAGGRSLPMP